MSGPFSSVQCVRAATFAHDRKVVPSGISRTEHAHASPDSLRAFSAAQSLASQFEAPAVSLRNKTCVERCHGGQRDAVTLVRPILGAGAGVSHETAALDIKLISPSLQRRETVALNTGGVVQGLPGIQPEPALVRCVPVNKQQGVLAGCTPPLDEANYKRVSSSADPRDGGSPSCSAKEGGRHAPVPPKAGPLHQESGGLNTKSSPDFYAAHCGPVGKNSNSAAGSQRVQDIDPAALIQSGGAVLPSARVRGAKASAEHRPAGGSSRVVRRTDGVAPVAQPGSAPQPERPVVEVTRSNRVGGSGLCMEPGLASAQHLGSVSRLAPVSESLTDLEERRIGKLFKLYPWEWLMSPEDGGLADRIPGLDMQFIEPAWKAMLSCKGILPILWEMYPGHPNLLECYADGPHGMRDFVMKPFYSREGQNVSIVKDGKVVLDTPGDSAEERVIWQRRAELFESGGNHAVIGSWIVGDEPAGMGIRESASPITGNLAMFAPHVIEEAS